MLLGKDAAVFYQFKDRQEDSDEPGPRARRLEQRSQRDRSVALQQAKDLVLVDSDAVRFLCACANDSIVLRNCPPYIRTWMAREGEQP